MTESCTLPTIRGVRSTALMLWLLSQAADSAFQQSMPSVWGSSTTTTLKQPRPTCSCLFMSGYGIANNYSWTEEALEIEVTIQVPPGTKAKDVRFSPGITSVDLRVNVDGVDGPTDVILLDGDRKLRGRVSLDGTYWVFSDRKRSITVTLEKYFPHSLDDMQVVDYDWKGVYPGDEEEVSERKYDEPEVLNVREYAASLGVDIDNINRTMVDETMFSSGLNLTKRALDQLTDKGYLTEVTQQADGTEYRANPENGEAEPFSFNKMKAEKAKDPRRINIPFIDTDSPWSQAVPVAVDSSTNKTSVISKDELREILKTSAANEQNKDVEDNEEEEDGAKSAGALADPIEQLTVKRLKEILRAQGLKVSGNKEELQERLRNQVNTILNEDRSLKGDSNSR